jgi:hypothetical protein
MNISASGGVFATTGRYGNTRKDVRHGGQAEVPCDSLTNILDATLGAGTLVDFLSLDVQGAEELVLSTVSDLTRFKVMLIELDSQAPSEIERIYSRLSAAGLVDVTFKRASFVSRDLDAWHSQQLTNRSLIRGIKRSRIFVRAVPRRVASVEAQDTTASVNARSAEFIEPIPTPGFSAWPKVSWPNVKDLETGLDHALAAVNQNTA